MNTVGVEREISEVSNLKYALSDDSKNLIVTNTLRKIVMKGLLDVSFPSNIHNILS